MRAVRHEQHINQQLAPLKVSGYDQYTSIWVGLDSILQRGGEEGGFINIKCLTSLCPRHILRRDTPSSLFHTFLFAICSL
jgi:hypothetical protein